MPYLKTKSGISWHFEVQGQGETILFLHGWGVDSNVWKQQFEYFSAACQVIAVDLPGHGQSSWQPVGLETMAADILEILQSHGIKKLSIAASSMGGLAALKLFSLNPSLVSRFVFVGFLPRFTEGPQYPHGLAPDQIEKLREQLDANYPATVHIFFRSLFTPYERRGERFKWLQTFKKTEAVPQKAALLAFLELLKTEDLRDILKTVLIPVQLVNGAEDYICPSASARFLHHSLPQSKLKIFKNCGHFPFLTRPREFNQLVEEFLHDS